MFIDYFNNEAIIKHICRERIKLANRLHDATQVDRLAGGAPIIPVAHPFYQLMPPRRQWGESRPRYRSSAMNADLVALRRTVAAGRREEQRSDWAFRLDHYIAGIRGRVFSNGIRFTPPEIRWSLKNPETREYRPICQFNPDDNLILCIFAKYLRDAFDDQFSTCSYAFRGRRRGGQMPNHHQAFNEIHHLKVSTSGQEFYVAECDIQGFFDAVDHDVALRAFRTFAASKTLDPIAETIFQAYLDCYSFPQTVLREASPRLRQFDPRGACKWPDGALRRYHGDPGNKRIGIPQGGAVSGIIANLVLDAADRAVEATRHELGAPVHYWRYCDDMVLISPSKTACRKAFDAYLAALQSLKLPYHKPEATWIYGSRHWDHKSKAPYRWSGQKWFGCVPWIQFVGYQVRYDGLVRPRKKSIQKQAEKLREMVGRLAFGLLQIRRPIFANRNQTRMSLKSKLVAQAVGRIKGGETWPKPMSWASGFKGLHQKPFVPGCLRFLDRMRWKAVRRFDTAQIQYGTGKPGQSVKRRESIGYAFSYEGQFINDGGRNLIQNPWRPTKLKDKWKAAIFNLCLKISNFLHQLD